jgi:NAD(P)-dependent dehydrogenase (short-subunit alcohol dehydrogenase family)
MMERVVITGASRGIGRAIALRLAGPGRELVLAGRSTAALVETATAVRAQGAAARVVTGNLATLTGVRALAGVAADGPVRTLVNCAGVAIVKSVEEISPEEWERGLFLNVSAPFLLTRSVLPRLEAGSSVVTILSVAARRGFPGWSAYCAAKFALEGFTQCLREELRGRGVRVINVYPSATDTAMWDGIAGTWPRERMIPPAQVAEAVAFALERSDRIVVDSIELGDVSGAL